MWELEFTVNNGLVFHILARMLHILVYVRMLVRTKFDAHSRRKSQMRKYIRIESESFESVGRP